MEDKDSHSTYLRVSGEEVIQQFYWLTVILTVLDFNWGQSYLATLVMPQNCIEMLRNLTFVV